MLVRDEGCREGNAGTGCGEGDVDAGCRMRDAGCGMGDAGTGCGEGCRAREGCSPWCPGLHAASQVAQGRPATSPGGEGVGRGQGAAPQAPFGG